MLRNGPVRGRPRSHFFLWFLEGSLISALELSLWFKDFGRLHYIFSKTLFTIIFSNRRSRCHTAFLWRHFPWSRSWRSFFYTHWPRTRLGVRLLRLLWGCWGHRILSFGNTFRNTGFTFWRFFFGVILNFPRSIPILGGWTWAGRWGGFLNFGFKVFGN